MTEITINKAKRARWGTVRRPNIRICYRKNGKIIGKVVLWPNFDMSHIGGPQDSIYLQGLWVHPSHRGKGISKELFQKLLETYGHQYIYLRAEAYDPNQEVSTSKLKKIYSSYGFRPTQIPPRYRGGFGDYDGLIVGTGDGAMVREKE